MTSTPAILGHDPQRAQLASDLQSSNVAHAYLFAGPAHVGKFTLAKRFAADLVLGAAPPDRREDAQARIDRMIHPDVLVLDKLWMEEVQEDWEEIAKFSNVPQGHRAKAPKAKTDVIGIDDVRAIQDRLQETGEGPVRVCLIRSVERMRDEAANALLKILEEPPPGRVFLLTTQSLTGILPTIISRSRVLQFGAVPLKDIAALLKGASEDDKAFILHVCRGAPGTALALLNDPDLLRIEQQAHAQSVAFWAKRSAHERLKILAPLHERGPDAERLLFHLHLALRQSGAATPSRYGPLARLVRDLQTNAHRQLVAQRFALDVAS